MNWMQMLVALLLFLLFGPIVWSCVPRLCTKDSLYHRNKIICYQRRYQEAELSQIVYCNNEVALQNYEHLEESDAITFEPDDDESRSHDVACLIFKESNSAFPWRGCAYAYKQNATVRELHELEYCWRCFYNYCNINQEEDDTESFEAQTGILRAMRKFFMRPFPKAINCTKDDIV